MNKEYELAYEIGLYENLKKVLMEKGKENWTIDDRLENRYIDNKLDALRFEQEKYNYKSRQSEEMVKLNNLIIKWAEDKGIRESGTVEGQKLKTIEELSELIIAVSKNNIDLIKDSIGDVYVTVVIGAMLENKEKSIEYNCIYDIDPNLILSELASIIALVNEESMSYCEIYYYIINRLDLIALFYKTSLIECVNIAYNEIKNRRGTMVNGIFKKE